MADRWVCLDVGETLIDETRVWTTWAEVLGVPAFTLMAAIGAVVAREAQFHSQAFALVGRPDWRTRVADFETRYGGFQATDLYPDALPALADLRAAGYRIALTANQPSRRTAELRALGVEADVIAMSDELGVHKPDPAFFARSLELMGDPDPTDVAYVGDRLDNDVRPALAAGLRPVWIRRGAWAVIAAEQPPAGALVVDSLAELVERLDEVWP